MTFRSLTARLTIDRFVMCLIGTVVFACILPARGEGAVVFGHLTVIAIGLLFFLYGARLSPQNALDGLRNWRLHLLVIAFTFGLFPLLGLGAKLLVPSVLTPDMYLGVMFLCTLPSTVQSSIAFTSIARGNVPAALCAASASNLLGIVITPVLVGVLMSRHGGGFSVHAVEDIVLQLLVPFAAGQLLRPWIGGFLTRNKHVLGLVDRGSILMVVYAAFSEGVVNGIWHQLTPVSLLFLLLTNLLLLALVLLISTVLSRRLGFSRADEIAIVFCGSKKSLASGLPMASVLFPASTVGLIVLPLMLFHQVQLMACAALARRYAARALEAEPGAQVMATARPAQA
jgi:sodium/bile acid cotransporter 7